VDQFPALQYILEMIMGEKGNHKSDTAFFIFISTKSTKKVYIGLRSYTAAS